MKTLLILLSSLLIVQSCKKNIHKAKEYSHNKFKKIKATDSTSFIQWTDGKIVFQSSKPLDNNYLDEKTYPLWNNSKYLCFRHSNGSDTWTDMILPLKNNEVKFYENPISYDMDNGIVVYETDSLNYKLIAENIDSGKTELIGENWENCDSVFPHYCIDKISTNNKELYVEWVLPNKMANKSIKVVKKQKLDL